MTDNRTVVFGLDGACLDVVEPWLDAGRLPTLAGVLDRGGVTRIESTVPATTPPAWTSLTTGVDPGKHGVFGFYRRHCDDYGVSPVDDGCVHARRIWDYTTAHDTTALVVNVPVTHPARPIDGAIVPGYLGPDRPTPSPADALEGLDGDYRVYAPEEGVDGEPDRDRLLEQWLGITERRRDAALHLMARYDWDLLFLEFQKTDSAFHAFEDDERIRSVYEAVDRCMGDVVAALDDPNVVVVSDHGIGQEKRWTVNLNRWLADQGYLTTTRDGTEASADTGATDAAVPTGGGSETPLYARLAADLLRRTGTTLQDLERALDRAGLYGAVRRLAPRGISGHLPEESVDFAASVAFYPAIGFSGVDAGVVVNDAGFYDEGLVAPEEYDAVRDGLRDALAEMRGPDGTAPFAAVRRREEVYEGPRVDEAPDLVLEQADDYVIGSPTPRADVYHTVEGHRVDHRRHGLLAAAGPDVTDDWEADSVPSVTDVPPTVLALLGVPPATAFDGVPLEAALASTDLPEPEDYGPWEPPRPDDGRGDEEAMRERLGNLGYLE